MPLKITRCPENPIVWPGFYPWRMAVTFNPAVLYDGGRFVMYERAAGSLRPFQCSIGMLESEDGVHFAHVSPQPVITPKMLGSKYGSVQDPRVVKIDGVAYMTYAFRPYAWHSDPTGVGVPDSHQGEFPGFSGRDEENQTRSGIARSDDLVHWEHVTWVNPPGIDDRNVILFPEKIGGRFAVLRRPSPLVTTEAKHALTPGIRISFSENLLTWTEPEPVIEPCLWWESNRIGGSTPPIRTTEGWLALYHGVENVDPATRRVCYRLGAMMLDPKDPRRVLARCAEPILEPEAYYEKFGLYIPNVIFPTGAVVVHGVLHVYYGACDTAICLATVPLEELVEHVMQSSL
jgi:predicted GH43/DUF377 family glycosyl hydrolase